MRWMVNRMVNIRKDRHLKDGQMKWWVGGWVEKDGYVNSWTDGLASRHRVWQPKMNTSIYIRSYMFHVMSTQSIERQHYVSPRELGHVFVTASTNRLRWKLRCLTSEAESYKGTLCLLASLSLRTGASGASRHHIEVRPCMKPPCGGDHPELDR